MLEMLFSADFSLFPLSERSFAQEKKQCPHVAKSNHYFFCRIKPGSPQCKVQELVFRALWMNLFILQKHSGTLTLASTHFTGVIFTLYDRICIKLNDVFCIFLFYFLFQCAGFMMTLKGLPSTYNKDLQVQKCVIVCFHLMIFFFSGDFLSEVYVMLSLSSLFRRIRRPCLTAMTLSMLCCR